MIDTNSNVNPAPNPGSMPPPLNPIQPQKTASPGIAKFAFVAGIITASLSVILLILGLISFREYTSLHELTYFTFPTACALVVFAIVTLILGIISVSKGGGKKAATGAWCAGGSILALAAVICIGIATIVRHADYVNSLWLHDTEDFYDNLYEEVEAAPSYYDDYAEPAVDEAYDDYDYYD